MKIVITGGHSTGVALIEEIKKVHPEWQIYYFGRRYALEGKKALSFDFKIVSKIKGVNFIPLTTGRLQRRFSWTTLPSLFKIPLGFGQAFYHLWRIRPEVIASFGGYLSVPVVMAGWLLGIPAITHEQTQTLGLANKINLFFVKKIAVSFPELLKQIPSRKGVYTGMLLPDSLKNKQEPGSLVKVALWARKTKRKIIFVTGGKTGSQTINQLLLAILPTLLEKYIVVHQTGNLEWVKFKKRAAKTKFYYPVDLLPKKEWGWIMNHAWVIVSRAGAHIVSEAVFLHRPIILIPLPWSYQDEQRKNALWVKKLGGGEILEQSEASPQRLWKILQKVAERRSWYVNNLRQAKIKNGKKLFLSQVEKLLS